MEESYEEFRGGNLEIVERRWILIAGECKAASGMGYDRRERHSTESVELFFPFFPFFFVLYWREISVSNLISEERFLFLKRINLLIYIYIFIILKQHFIRNTKVFVSYIFSTSV